jgi:hypothetical protein
MRSGVRNSLAAFLTIAVLAAAGPAEAAPQVQPGVRSGGARQVLSVPAAPADQTIVFDDQDARQMSKELNDLLRRYPPALGRVLKIDPSLLSNQSYLAPYPALAAFLAQHPQIARNSGYFLQSVSTPDSSWVPESDSSRVKTEAISMWRNTFSDLTAFFVFVVITGTLAWVIRLLVDYRRWNRLSKVQADVHNKLLDRFTSNEDLLAYAQSPAGSRFLQSAPISLDTGTRSLGAPFGRILWSMQAGLVLAAGGFGLMWVSGHVGLGAEIAQPIYVMGVIAVSLGVGFVLSAAAAYVLSRRFGLLEPIAPAPAVEHGRGSHV